MPIFRNDEERATVLGFCERLNQDLKAQSYNGEPVRVHIDTRDMRGGETFMEKGDVVAANLKVADAMVAAIAPHLGSL